MTPSPSDLVPPTEPEEIQHHSGSAWRGLMWILSASGLILGLYLSLPLFAKEVPWSFEKSIARNVTLYQPDAICTANAPAIAAFHQVLRRIYPIYPADHRFPVEASVIRGREVNAFAFLAGRIFVYNGLIEQADSPEELAAVLAHEIEHVRQRHVTEGLIQGAMIYLAGQFALPGSSLGSIAGLLGTAARLKFSRGQEAAADEGALKRLRDAHVSVAGFKRFFMKMHHEAELPSLLSDHPSNQSRLNTVNAFPAFPSTPVLKAGQWRTLKKICSVKPRS